MSVQVRGKYLVFELQSLVGYIEPGDTLLLEWAGVPEFPN